MRAVARARARARGVGEGEDCSSSSSACSNDGSAPHHTLTHVCPQAPSSCAVPAKKKTLARGASGGELSPTAGTLRCTTSCRLSSAALSARVSSSSPSSVGLLKPARREGSGCERQRRNRALRRATHVGPLRKGIARGGCRPGRPSRVCWPSCARSRDHRAAAAPAAPCPPSSFPALSAGRQGSCWRPVARQADCSPQHARTASGQCAGGAFHPSAERGSARVHRLYYGTPHRDHHQNRHMKKYLTTVCSRNG